MKVAVVETIDQLRRAGDLDAERPGLKENMAEMLTPKYGYWFARQASLEDVQQLSQDVARELAAAGLLTDVVRALQFKESVPLTVWHRSLEALGSKRRTLAGELLKAIEIQRAKLWRERVALINYELVDQAAPTFNWYALEELAKTTGQTPAECCRTWHADRDVRGTHARGSAWSSQVGYGHNASSFGRGWSNGG